VEARRGSARPANSVEPAAVQESRCCRCFHPYLEGCPEWRKLAVSLSSGGRPDVAHGELLAPVSRSVLARLEKCSNEASIVAESPVWNHEEVRPSLLLTSRRHIDLVRVAGATC